MLKKRVPRTGLEPARLAAHAPETCASTNSATWAFSVCKYQTLFRMLSGKRDSDPRPQPWQGCALPTELFPLVYRTKLSVLAYLSRLRMQRYDFFSNCQNFSMFFFKKSTNPCDFCSLRSQIGAKSRDFRRILAFRWQDV